MDEEKTDYFLELIEKGESETLEFKPSLSQINEILEAIEIPLNLVPYSLVISIYTFPLWSSIINGNVYISALANKKGGKVLIGVSDSGKIQGVDVGKDTIEKLTNKINSHIEPKIYPKISVENQNLILIEIEESPDKPVLAFGRAFKRVGKSTLKMSRDEQEKIVLEKNKINFDSEICEKATLDDIDWDFVKKEFIPLYENISENKIEGELKELLESFGCIKDNKLTNSAILLFGKEPQKFFMNAYIALARYKGDTEDNERLDYKEFTGNLFRQVDKCNAYIREHTAIMSKLNPGEVKREDIPEYGFFSIRELITNAVVHRDYLEIGTKIIIKMFDNRIDYYNAGGLTNDITPVNILQRQYSRNPIIARVLSKVKYIEELGEGWNKIIKEHKEHPLSPILPQIITDKSSMLVSLYSAKEKFEKKEDVLILNERQRHILQTIKTQGFIKSIDLQKRFNITRDTVNRDINYLIQLKLIKMEGIGKAIKYVLV